MRTFVVAFALFTVTLPTWADPESEGKLSPTPRVQQWIADLDSDSFRAREEATRELAKNCTQAASLLAKLIAKDGSPESKRRALEILVAGAASSHKENAQASIRELKQFQKSSDKRLAAMAENALDGWRVKVRLQQIEAVRAMGGNVQICEDIGAYFMYTVPSAKARSSAELAAAYEKALANERIVSKKADEIAKELGTISKKVATPAERPKFTPKLIPGFADEEDVMLLADVILPADTLEIVTLFASSPAVSEEGTSLSITINGSWSGGDDGFATIADMNSVVMLDLHDVKISNAAVRHIVQMKELRNLQIYKGQIDAAPYRALRTVRPDIHIFGTGDGYLGVNGSGGSEEGFLVTGAVEGGGAHQSGIRKGDLITSLNGIPVKTLGDISLFVYNRKGGYPFQAELVRDGEKKVVKGKIGNRE